MKYVMVKIYDVQKNFGLCVQYLRIKNNLKIIDREIYKTFQDYKSLKLFLNEYPITIEYAKSKILITYISNDVFVEIINHSTDVINNKVDLKKKIEELYPNYSSRFEVELCISNFGTKQKLYFGKFLSKKKMQLIKENFEFINNQKVFIDFDFNICQKFLTKHKNYFFKKRVLLIQWDNEHLRVLDIDNSNLISYLLINEKEENFEQLISCVYELMNKRYDEIIIDSDFKKFIKFTEKWPNLNFVFIEHIDKLRNFDERKIVYASVNK